MHTVLAVDTALVEAAMMNQQVSGQHAAKIPPRMSSWAPCKQSHRSRWMRIAAIA